MFILCSIYSSTSPRKSKEIFALSEEMHKRSFLGESLRQVKEKYHFLPDAIHQNHQSTQAQTEIFYFLSRKKKFNGETLALLIDDICMNSVRWVNKFSFVKLFYKLHDLRLRWGFEIYLLLRLREPKTSHIGNNFSLEGEKFRHAFSLVNFDFSKSLKNLKVELPLR